MTEETPETGRDEYGFPEKQFSTLYEQEVGSPHYKIEAANLTDGLRSRGIGSEANEVFDYLEEGDVESAEELTDELLEERGGML